MAEENLPPVNMNNRLQTGLFCCNPLTFAADIFLNNDYCST
jgi:hypothetical protein